MQQNFGVGYAKSGDPLALFLGRNETRKLPWESHENDTGKHSRGPKTPFSITKIIVLSARSQTVGSFSESQPIRSLARCISNTHMCITCRFGVSSGFEGSQIC